MDSPSGPFTYDVCTEGGGQGLQCRDELVALAAAWTIDLKKDTFLGPDFFFV